MIVIPGLLSGEQLRDVHARLDMANWIDGNATSGHQSAHAKRNRQLAEDDPEAKALGNFILDALAAAPLFVAAALPLKVYPPLFNLYGEGEQFGDHVDSAIRIRAGSDFRGQFNHGRMLAARGEITQALLWISRAWENGNARFRAQMIDYLTRHGEPFRSLIRNLKGKAA